jgi:cobalt/nickel transport system permease protein
VSALAAALQDLRSLDTLAARATPLAQRDARAKLLVTGLFVVTVASFDRYRVAALLPLALFPTVLWAQAELPARLLLRLLLLASPLALMVGLFNPLLDRAPLLWLAGHPVAGGWISLLAILLRFLLTASAALLLLAGTGMPALCAALARLGVPRGFTVQLLLLHRYLFVLAGEALRLHTARQLRAGQRQRLPLRQWTGLIGALLLRALDRANRVHQAMLARGFDGELRLARRGHWRRADTLFTLGWCAAFALARGIDLPQAIGRLLTGVGA